jgi:ABC-type phosphate transport system substrate-binding protein
MLMLGVLSTSQAMAIEVVTHPNVTDNNLTKSQLRRIYTMRQLRWSDDSAISVFVLPNHHPIHERFAKEQLQIFPYQLNRIWHKLTYSGLGVAPIVVDSEQALIQAVLNTPGAIGYIEDMSLVEIKLNQSEKVTVTINNTQESPATEKQQKDQGKGVINVIKIKG